jgi:hypothetical protein
MEPAAVSSHSAAFSDSFADQCFFGSSSFCFFAGIPIPFPRDRAVVSFRLFSSLGSRFALGEEQFRVVLLGRIYDLVILQLWFGLCVFVQEILNTWFPASKGGVLGSFRCSLLVHPIIRMRWPVMTA